MTLKSMSSHWKTVCRRLAVDVSLFHEDDWVAVDQARFSALDLDMPSLDDDMTFEAIDALRSLKAFADNERATITIFARLV
jgi:hypothetical protein